MAEVTRHIYMRICVYTLTIAMHVGNMWYLNTRFQSCEEVSQDPYLPVFAALQSRFLTCWTFFLQVVHAIVGLICDALILRNLSDEKYRLPKHLRGFKETLFSAILWPSSCIVFSVFWILYNYDRSLIYPSFVDKILTPTSNHIMHSSIIPVAIWEMYYRPRSKPRSHKRNLYHLIFYFILYLVIIIYTYLEQGVWLYPIFKVLYGTVYFPFIFVVVSLAALTFYFGQWQIISVFWSTKLKKKIT